MVLSIFRAIGKNWGKGLTAATDERVARSARAHTGLTYTRRTPIEQCKWWRGPRVEIGPIPWSSGFAYAAGLFTTDGSMSIRKSNQAKHLGFWSKDRELVETYLECIGLRQKIRTRERHAFGGTWIGHETTFSSVRLFQWYEEIGLMPRKSLVLGAITVPDEYFFDLVRGLLDGDGSIARYTDARGRRCFSLRFYSASEAHVCWLRDELKRRLGIAGSLRSRTKSKGLGRRPIWQLQYARVASRRLAAAVYADPTAPRLERKWVRWLAEIQSGMVS